LYNFRLNLTLSFTNERTLDDIGFWPSHKHSSILNSSFDSSTKSYRSFGVSNVVSFNDIQIRGICSREKSLCLVNTTKRLVDLTGWRICAFVDGIVTLDYKFMANVFFWPDQEIKVRLKLMVS